MDFSHLHFDCRIDDPKRVAEAFAQSECVALENAFDREKLGEIGEVCRAFFAAVEGRDSPTPQERSTLITGSAGAMFVGDVLFSDGPQFHERVCSFLREQPIVPFLNAILGADSAAFLQSALGVRRKNPRAETTLLPFHQDAFHWAGLNDARPSITAFTPFSDVGAAYPGLDLIARKFERLLPLSEDPNASSPHLHLAEELLSADDLAHLWSPVVRFGGAIVFSGRTPHRSQHSAMNAAARLSMDLRFVDAENPPEHYRDKWIFDLASGAYRAEGPSGLKRLPLGYRPRKRPAA